MKKLSQILIIFCGLCACDGNTRIQNLNRLHQLYDTCMEVEKSQSKCEPIFNEILKLQDNSK